MYAQQENRGLGPGFSRNQSFSVKRGASALSQVKLQRGGSLPTKGLDLADSRSRGCLLPDDVIEKYREALVHYAKVQYWYIDILIRLMFG